MSLGGKSVNQEQNYFKQCLVYLRPCLLWNVFTLSQCFLSIDFQLDINECKGSNNDCDKNANCSNTVGFYNCICKEGFTGDGHFCSGKIVTDMPRKIFNYFSPKNTGGKFELSTIEWVNNRPMIACMLYQRSLSIKQHNFSRNYYPPNTEFCFLSCITHACLCTELPWSTSGFFRAMK